ncbi:putative Retrovirus-related Pol polyprotein from transposon [Paratrimastix pyriformis]|uniref:Retrovirus-related Pol polyprotein from transposon n=1 Tax=Paratrimastix pyriformis TaxID=342808 RepID=A0ABQ8UGA0_9EUKA|nr:putative Retrovirus-related Pol polyprotein from transposon [Paratrimastix pyriformis]
MACSAEYSAPRATVTATPPLSPRPPSPSPQTPLLQRQQRNRDPPVPIELPPPPAYSDQLPPIPADIWTRVTPGARPDDPTVAALIAIAHTATAGVHLGEGRTRALLHTVTSWPNDSQDVHTFVSHCPICQIARLPANPDHPADVHAIPPAFPFHSVEIDTVGPLAPASGYRHILVCVDVCTRFTELTPLSDLEATTVAAALLDSWVLRHGVPKLVIGDGAFASTVVKELTALLQARLHLSLPLDPRGHGRVERRNLDVEQMLRTLLTADHYVKNWPSHVPAVHSYTNASCTLSEVAAAEKRQFDARRAKYLAALPPAHTADYSPGDLVLLLHPRPHKLLPPSSGPFAIVGPGDNAASFMLRNLLTGEQFLASANRLKRFLQPAYSTQEDTAILAIPPGEAIVKEVLDHALDPLRFLVRWHTGATAWIPYRGNSNSAPLIAYMHARGIHPRKLSKKGG